MLPSRSSVTRLFGSGRSSEVSQKSSECLRHQVEREAGRDRRRAASSVSPSSLPTNEIWPIGYSQSCDAEVEIVHRKRLLKHRRIRALARSPSSTELMCPM